MSRTPLNARQRGYRVAFNSYRRLLEEDALIPTKATLQEFVVRLRERGIRPVRRLPRDHFNPSSTSISPSQRM